MTKPKKLYRSKSDRIFAGVAGGLGHYFAIDAVLIRALFILFTFVNGLGLLLYLVLLIIIPGEKGKEKTIDRKEKMKEFVEDLGKETQDLASHIKENKGWFSQKRNLIGLLVILVGLFALLNQILPWRWLGWEHLVAILVILLGLFIIFKKES